MRSRRAHYRFHDLRHSFGTDLADSGRTFDDFGAIVGIEAEVARILEAIDWIERRGLMDYRREPT